MRREREDQYRQRFEQEQVVVREGARGKRVKRVKSKRGSRDSKARQGEKHQRQGIQERNTTNNGTNTLVLAL
jgi:hypothetical protein